MISEIIKSAAPILDKFVEDKDAKAKIKAELTIYYRTTSSASSCKCRTSKAFIIVCGWSKTSHYVDMRPGFDDTVFFNADS